MLYVCMYACMQYCFFISCYCYFLSFFPLLLQEFLFLIFNFILTMHSSMFFHVFFVFVFIFFFVFNSISSSYPGLPTAYVAEKIVRGMLLNERMVYVPKIFALSVWLLR